MVDDYLPNNVYPEVQDNASLNLSGRKKVEKTHDFYLVFMAKCSK